MINNMQCPLCENRTINKIDTINKEDLIKLYKKVLSVDVGYLVKQNIDFCECQNCKLKFYSPLITGDEKFYTSLQKFDWYYMDEKEEYVYAKENIKPTDKVLDVGSGKGAFAKHLTTKHYVGLDFSENAKKMAQENNVTIENQSIEYYAQIHKEKFDVVVSFQVLEHVSNPKLFIESKIKALKIGGKLMVGVPSEDSYLKYITNSILNMPPHHVTRWSDETFQYIAKKYTLEIDTIYHEKIQEVHKQLFLTTLLKSLLIPYKLIDMSLKNKFILKCCGFLSKRISKRFKNDILPNGNTVLVIYTKK